jgi:hypothetical protein
LLLLLLLLLSLLLPLLQGMGQRTYGNGNIYTGGGRRPGTAAMCDAPLMVMPCSPWQGHRTTQLFEWLTPLLFCSAAVTGQFCAGEMHGTGTLQLACGAVYEGQMSHNKYQGAPPPP